MRPSVTAVYVAWGASGSYSLFGVWGGYIQTLRSVSGAAGAGRKRKGIKITLARAAHLSMTFPVEQRPGFWLAPGRLFLKVRQPQTQRRSQPPWGGDWGTVGGRAQGLWESGCRCTPKASGKSRRQRQQAGEGRAVALVPTTSQKDVLNGDKRMDLQVPAETWQDLWEHFPSR